MGLLQRDVFWKVSRRNEQTAYKARDGLERFVADRTKMKKFTIRALGLNPDEQKIWRGAGFSIMQELPPSSYEGELPELIWLAKNIAGGPLDCLVAEELRTAYPKLFFLPRVATTMMPGHWAAYAQQRVSVAGTDWTVGSKLEEPLPREVSEYLAQQKTAELAAVLYIVILESVFRETAEWCGHMSSVVGRM